MIKQWKQGFLDNKLALASSALVDALMNTTIIV
jgi:hypothetical protein